MVMGIVTMVMGAYWNILQTINAQQVTLAGYEARLTIAEKSLQARQAAEDSFASEMRSALAQIQIGIADLRVQEAQRLGGKR